MYTAYGHIRNPSVEATVVDGEIQEGTFRFGTYTFAIDVPIRSNFLQGTRCTMHGDDDWGPHGMTGKVGGLWYLVGDKIISRWDAVHGPRHGGRHPWILWRVSGGKVERLPGALDRNEFTNGYEVHMEHPVVAGFLLERNEEGRVVCYDLAPPALRAASRTP